MTLEKIHRFMFVIAAVALFLASVMPSMDVSANMAGSPPMVTMAATDGMDCPDRDASWDKMVGCVQAMCIGFAVIADGDCHKVSAAQPAYAIASVAWPDDFKSAPSTPPI